MRSFAFIDASNLFYGGEKSLGWKIDYQKLLSYLFRKYNISTAFYFGGVETHGFVYDYLKEVTVPITELKRYLMGLMDEKGGDLNLNLLKNHLQRVRFYINLERFGFRLFLKPVKSYQEENGIRRKANCDVDMAFHLMKEKENFDRVVILSGDGDFLPVLKYLKEEGKEVIVLARGSRTAKEIRKFAGGDFRDFVRLEKSIKFIEK